MASATASVCSDHKDEVAPRTETIGVSAPADRARTTISRERTVRMTEEKYVKSGKSDVKKMSLHERLAEFSNELFRNACKERISRSTKKSILKSHFTSTEET